jgi:hypothetical protein
MEEIPYGYCHCGCGNKTNLCTRTNTLRGWVTGMPEKFLPYHHNRLPKGSRAANWREGKIQRSGYFMTLYREHPRSSVDGYVLEHILIIEKAMGKPFLPPHEGHHFNGIRTDNSRGNLVACEDRQYHMILEQRTRAYFACGHAHWRKCPFCKEYDDPKNLYITLNNIYHKQCMLLSQRIRRGRRTNGRVSSIQ